MKTLSKIIGVLMAVTLLFQSAVPVGVALAQSGAENREGAISRPTPPETECEKPDFNVLYLEWVDAQTHDASEYREAFERGQTAYHNYISCIFAFAEKTILKSNGLSQGTIQANTPNARDSLPPFDWMTPSAACLKPDELKQIALATEPNAMLPPILEALETYKKYLKDILIYYTNGKGGGENKVFFRNIFEYERLTEIDSATVAVSNTFVALKELRLAFVMHVHFQCLLNNLDKYRRLLGEIRGIIEVLPSALLDASITK